MTDKRPANYDRDSDRSARDEREREQADDLAKRREQTRQAQLTNRERDARWPIG